MPSIKRVRMHCRCPTCMVAKTQTWHHDNIQRSRAVRVRPFRRESTRSGRARASGTNHRARIIRLASPVQAKTITSLVSKAPLGRRRLTGKIRGATRAVEAKECRPPNAIKTRATHSHLLHIRGSRNRKLGRMQPAPQACSNRRARTS